MLGSMMRRLLPLLLVCVAASTASADGYYFSESFGGTKVKDELSAYLPSAVRFRLAIGLRRQAWALEGFVAGDLNDALYTDYSKTSSLTTYGLDLKYLKPVSRHIDVYLRGSVGHGIADGALEGYEGRGLGFGAGVQLKGKVPAIGFLWWPLFFTNWGPKGTAALFLDDGYDFYRLHRGGDLHATAIDAQLTHLTGGFAVGTDF